MLNFLQKNIINFKNIYKVFYIYFKLFTNFYIYSFGKDKKIVTIFRKQIKSFMAPDVRLFKMIWTNFK